MHVEGLLLDASSVLVTLVERSNDGGRTSRRTSARGGCTQPQLDASRPSSNFDLFPR